MVTKDEARKYLSDVAPEQCFWVNNGPILKNLDELANAMPDINDDTFYNHVNSEKNDFSNWIRDVIGDQALAKDLLSSQDKHSALRKIKNRLNSLRKRAG